LAELIVGRCFVSGMDGVKEMMEQDPNAKQPSPQATAPKVSIGVPVYNGEQYLEACLDSLLAQTHGDFEIIISDNGSTDGTADICRRYVERDPRVRYFRVDENRGASWNFNRTLELAAGEYFKWAAHDDLCAPRFIESCVEVLDRDPSVVLCCPKPRVINEQGEQQAAYPVNLDTDSPEPQIRYREIIRGVCGHKCFEVFGLIRMSALKNSQWMGNYPHADGVLLARLALLGRFHEVPQELFFPREHADQSMKAMKDRYAYAAWFDTRRAGKIIFPTWRMFWEYFRCVGGSPTTAWQRVKCHLHLMRSAISYRRKFLRDIVQAWRMKRHGRSRKPMSAGSSKAASPSTASGRGSANR